MYLAGTDVIYLSIYLGYSLPLRERLKAMPSEGFYAPHLLMTVKAG